MRLKGRQARFLLALFGAWTAARVAMLWPAGVDAPVELAEMEPAGDRATKTAWPGVAIRDGAVPMRAATARRPHRDAGPVAGSVAGPEGAPGEEIADELRDAPGPAPAEGAGAWSVGPPAGPGLAETRMAAWEPPRPDDARHEPGAARALRVEGEVYLFVRPGSGRALAAGSALGGSQAAARVAVVLDAGGHLAAAARVYAPLASAGAEGAVGIDWRPDPDLPLRLSVERRVRLDPAGRSAWSAYAAGGFYRGLPGDLRLDGYAQAGLVGLRRRDLFVDGALRIERPLGRRIGIGAGLWGAAQPGAERLDAGPRGVVRLPVARHGLSLAVEGRFRLAGRARPGSGAAVTLAGDL